MYCRCCQKLVSPETFKAHARVREGLPRPVQKPTRKLKKRSSTQALRLRLRHHSSQKSINAHRGISPPLPLNLPPLPPADSPPVEYMDNGDTEPYNSDLEAIPESNLAHIWEQVMQVHEPIVLGNQELRSESSGTHTSQISSGSSGLEESNTDESADGDAVEYNPATYRLSPQSFIRGELWIKIAKQAPTTIGPEDLDTIRDFNF
ncbi:unnamed protein product, partial [Rhizoctonia solani]